MRIIRFIDGDGAVRHGVDRGDGTADLLAGDPTRGVQPTGTSAAVDRLVRPIEPAAIICIGLNYREHAAETGADLPRFPVMFMKNPAAANDPGAPIRLPRCSSGPEVDYEVELAVVIGRAARDVPAHRALEQVLGYTVANDVSARRWQESGGGGQWVRGKSFDTFCPLGPALVTPDQIPDPQVLDLSTTLNGQIMQQSSTSDMIFPVAELIAFASQDTTLLPRTVLLTGTPPGVGAARRPPVFLKAGDRVTCRVAQIGELTNPVA
jgi:2-keto-4-pentenoate hydratase/2-oxohepta-3-ene-1,7-dioic acid hydratase in catechol pathway